MARSKGSNNTNNKGEASDIEAILWASADKLRNNMDAAEYKHIVLGLIFLKYISDAFQERHAQLIKEQDQGANPEDADEYLSENVFWVPKEARWSYLKASARQPNIGKIVDEAMVAIERDNKSLKGVLPKDYARPALDSHRLGDLIDLISGIEMLDKKDKSKDVLGDVYQYFLKQFASSEGKKGGQFYTPQCVVQILVEMLAPYKGRVYDPCCGSGGMFVQSKKFVNAHEGRRDDISIYGQESNPTTWKILGDETLRQIARELVEAVRKNITIDWTVKESARAKLRVIVRRLLRKYGYPPDKQEKATQTVLEQAELLCKDWTS